MACTGIGPYTWYLYFDNWDLVDCVDTSSANYTFTGITTAGTYNVVVISDGYSATTQIVVTGNESCCWDTNIYQPCDEGCNRNGLSATTGGAIDLFFNKLNDSLGFNSTINLSSRPFDISVLYSSDVNKGSNVYFQSLLRSYECCSVEPGTEILFTAPCINDPIYKVLQVCNICDTDQWISGYTLSDGCPATSCPDGYTLIDGQCYGFQYTSAVYSGDSSIIMSGDQNYAYGSVGALFYEDITDLPCIIRTGVTTNLFYWISGTTHTLNMTNSKASAFWGNGSGPAYTGRLNHVGIVGTGYEETQWNGFSVCIDIPISDTYYIGLAADNECRFRINGDIRFALYCTDVAGVPTPNMCTTGANHQIWHVLPIQLSAGKTIIELEGRNDHTGTTGSFGIEIYSGITINELTGATSDVTAHVMWNTAQHIDGIFDYGESVGWQCPSGYALDLCNGVQCAQLTTANMVQCLENWDIRFMAYSGSCDSRELVEFDPNNTLWTFNNTCDDALYPYPECKCFYVAVGYRGDDINDKYSTLELILTDNTGDGLSTITYDLHGRSSINYPTTTPVVSLFNNLNSLFNTVVTPTSIESDCPTKPSCDCLVITSNDNTNDNNGYPISIAGEPYYRFTKTYTFFNKCYTEFDLAYSFVYPTYSGLTIDSSNFDGVLGKNETATLSLSYLSNSNSNVVGILGYNASTIDPFLCENATIDCPGALIFSFTAKPVPLMISNTPYNFGTVGNGCCSSSTFVIQNTGYITITISNLTLTNPAFILTQPVTPLATQQVLGIGGSLSTSIKFCPTGCTDGTISTTDLIISTVEFGDILASSLSSGFNLSGTCASPSISASTDSLVFIKMVDEQMVSGMTICNRTSLAQLVDMSNCIQFVSGSTSEIIDPLNYGFEIVIETQQTQQSSITYPRSLNIPANDCLSLDIRYDILQPNASFCSIYLRDNCGNITQIPFTGYSLPYPIVITSTSYTNPTCYGDTDGSITISFSGGAIPYNYIFSGGSTYQTGSVYSNTLTFNNLSATEIGTDYIFSLSGNPCDGSVTIPDLSPFVTPSSPEVVLSPLEITTLIQPTYFEIVGSDYTGKTCVQLGAVSVSVTGGTEPYVFTWSNGTIQTGMTTPYTTIVDGLDSGTYGVNVRDFNGCQKYINVTIPTLLPITNTITTTSVSCYGGENGSATLILSNAVDPVSYYWSGYTYDSYEVFPLHTDTFSSTTANNLTAGTYYVSYLDFNGCSADTTFNILQPLILGFNVTSTDVTCSYLTNGTITFNPITGGTYPYTVYASGNTTTYSSSTLQILTNIDGGDYDTYVIDYNGCVTSYSPITIFKPDPITISYDYTATTCFNSSDGQILLTVTGGTGPYSYLWNPSIGSTNYITGLAHGNYNVSIFDSSGCSLFTGLTLPFNSSYCGDMVVLDGNGNIVTLVDGVYPITTPSTCLSTLSETLISLCQNSPCTFNLLSYSGISVNVDDFYLGLDLIGLSVPSSACTTISLIFNPTSAQTYNKTFSVTTEYCTHYFSISGTGVENIISADTQSIDFGDVCFGTADTRYVTILNLTPDTRAMSIQTVPSEFSSLNTFILSGNSSISIPYTFTPTYPLTNPVIWEREFTGTTKITNCPTLEIQLSGTGYGGNLYVSNIDFGCVNKNCYSDMTGTIYNTHCLPVSISAVTIPSYYSSVLSVLGFTPTIIPAGGSSTFTVRYSATTSINTYVSVQTGFSLATILISGITACMVNTLGNIDTISSLFTIPGLPTSTVVDVTNTTETNLFVSANIKNATGGTVTNVTVAPLLIALPSPAFPLTSTTNSFTISFNDVNPVNEWFNLNLTDNCGNHVSLPFYVSSNPIGYINEIITYPTCYGVDSGSITITPTGGIAPYLVVWDNGVTGTSITNLSAGTYNVDIYDNDWNVDSFSFNITEPNPLGVSHSVPFNGYVNILVYSANTGYIDLTVTGGTLPYIYYWSGATYQGVQITSDQQDLTGLTAGNYFATITDANGCQITDFISLTQPDPLSITITNCTPPVPPTLSCTLTGGTADIVVSGGQGPYVIIVCPTVPQNPLFDVGGPYYGLTTCQILPSCSGVTSGTPCVTQTCYCCDGSLAPCLIPSCPITLCNIVIENLPPGTYPPGTFGVIDANSGTTTYTIPAFVPDPSTLGFNLSQSPTTCGGQSNGSITATIVPTMNELGQYGMGVPPYTYYLNGVQQGVSTTAITETFTGLTSAIYTISVEDSDFNVVTKTIFVTQGKLSASITTVSETLQEANGSITINTIYGGIGPYTATINSSTPKTIYDGYVFGNLTTGTYLIEITDSLGCKFIIKPIVSRIIPSDPGQKKSNNKTSISNPTIYQKRLGGFKLTQKK